MPAVLYLLFALLSVTGAYLVGAHVRSRAAGAGAALLTAVFFALLAWGLLALLRQAGFS